MKLHGNNILTDYVGMYQLIIITVSIPKLVILAEVTSFLELYVTLYNRIIIIMRLMDRLSIYKHSNESQ